MLEVRNRFGQYEKLCCPCFWISPFFFQKNKQLLLEKCNIRLSNIAMNVRSFIVISSLKILFLTALERMQPWNSQTLALRLCSVTKRRWRQLVEHLNMLLWVETHFTLSFLSHTPPEPWFVLTHGNIIHSPRFSMRSHMESKSTCGVVVLLCTFCCVVSRHSMEIRKMNFSTVFARPNTNSSVRIGTRLAMTQRIWSATSLNSIPIRYSFGAHVSFSLVG